VSADAVTADTAQPRGDIGTGIDVYQYLHVQLLIIHNAFSKAQ
jgi:hypothetical protein